MLKRYTFIFGCNQLFDPTVIVKKTLTLLEVPWTCPLVGCGTLGLHHSHTPWQNTGGPVGMQKNKRRFIKGGETKCSSAFM